MEEIKQQIEQIFNLPLNNAQLKKQLLILIMAHILNYSSNADVETLKKLEIDFDSLIDA